MQQDLVSRVADHLTVWQPFGRIPVSQDLVMNFMADRRNARTIVGYQRRPELSHDVTVRYDGK